MLVHFALWRGKARHALYSYWADNSKYQYYLNQRWYWYWINTSAIGLTFVSIAYKTFNNISKPQIIKGG